MRRMGAILLLTAGAGLLGCGAGNTEFESTWRDPSVQSIQFTKVLAVAISKEQGQRRTFEDEMVKIITANGNAQAVQSYTLLGDIRDTAQAKQKANEAGIDGVVTMRVIGSEKEQRLVGGSAVPSYYGRPWGYYGYGWGSVYDPGYLVTDEMVQVETNIYSLKENKLIWAGRSETTNPGSVQELIDDVARAVGEELRRQNLLPPLQPKS